MVSRLAVSRAIGQFILASMAACANSWGADEAASAAPMPTTAPARVAVLISDLHLGFGKVQAPEPTSSASAPWHRMEDFRWPVEFDAFLTSVEKMWTKKGRPVDLVILGDFLELWQAPPGERDCIYDASGARVKGATGPFLDLAVRHNLSCNATDAETRANRVIAAHADVLARLGRFATQGDNRVVIVPGNHDAAFVFKDIQQATLKAIGAPPGRASVATEGYWRSLDGQVVAEHGHFIKGDVNAYDAYPVQCLDASDKAVPCDGSKEQTYLARPWGEQFVQDYYDRYEDRFPIVDNITSEMAGLTEAVNASSGIERLKAVGRALKFLLLQQSWRQFGALLGPDGQVIKPANWSVKAIRDKGDDAFFEESLPANHPLRNDVKQLRVSGELDLHLASLSDEEIVKVCDSRAAMRRSLPADQAPALCPGDPGTLGAIKAKLMTTGAQRLADRMEEVRRTLAAPSEPGKKPGLDFGIYVYAHTHAVHGACKAHEVLGRVVRARDGVTPWRPIAYNTGAWQRVVTPLRLSQMKSEKPTKPLSDYVPEDLPACFSMIVVTPGSKDGGPSAQPWFWAKKLGYWNFTQSCPEDPTQLPENACSD
jgi:UDP-2,3-diacylglucosamine pyrophosphatase LpxH